MLLKSLYNNEESSDIVIWDMGTPAYPLMSVVASTCRGWITIKVKGREFLSENFGVSFTPREMTVLKQFFKIWKLDGGQSVASAIENIYEQTYVKDFKPGPNEMRLDREEFKIFVNKLLLIINISEKQK